MNTQRTDLSRYDNSWYDPGGNRATRTLWFAVNALFFRSPFPLSRVKVALLRAFGASVGENVVIKPFVNIKYPWHLKVGNHVWIGERVWIDNLTQVTLDDNVCLSQDALLLTGNHDYSRSSFDLKVSEIRVEEGAWVGARAVVCPGVTCRFHSVLSVGSVATSNLEPFTINRGNPAVKIRDRQISK